MIGFERFFNLNLEDTISPIENRYIVDAQALSKSKSGTVTRFAFDLKERRPVVIKSIQPGSRELPLLCQKIRMEAEALSQFDHFALPKLLDLFNEDDTGLPVIVMNDIEGRSLAQNTRGIQLSQARWMMEDLAAGIDYAASKGVHSGDIWEGNVLISNSTATLIDFGNTNLAPPKAVQVTRHRSAPEFYDTHLATTQSDVYSLAATIYSVITWHAPFVINSRETAEDTKPYERIYRPISEEEGTGLGLDGAQTNKLNNVFLRALDKTPDVRQSSATEFLNEFKSATLT